MDPQRVEFNQSRILNRVLKVRNLRRVPDDVQANREYVCFLWGVTTPQIFEDSYFESFIF